MSNPQIMTVRIAGQTFYSAPLNGEMREEVRQAANQKHHVPVDAIELSPPAARAIFLGLAHAWDVNAEIEGRRKYRDAPDSLARMTVRLSIDLAHEQTAALKKAVAETPI